MRLVQTIFAASLPAIVLADCPALVAEVQGIDAELVTVTDGNDNEMVRLDANAADQDGETATVTGGLRTDRLVFDTYDPAGELALRCDDESGSIVKFASTGALCSCTNGLWLNAMQPNLPCLVSYDVEDHLARGVSADAETAWPTGGPNAATLTAVPTFTEAIGATCDLETASGRFKRYGQLCTFQSNSAYTFADSRWQCLAAGGWLVTANDFENSSADWALESGEDVYPGLDIWLGFTHSAGVTGGVLQTAINGGSRFSQAPFPAGQPDNDGECTTTRTNFADDNHMGDIACDYENIGFMCGFPYVAHPDTRPTNVAAHKIMVASLVDPAIAVSYDSGTSWTVVNTGPDPNTAVDLALSGPNYAVIVDNGDVWQSYDDFATYEKVPGSAFTGDESYRRVDVDPLNPNNMAFSRVDGADMHIRVTRDLGQTWAVTADQIDQTQGRAIVRNDLIVVGSDNGNVHVSHDFGSTFTKVHDDDTGVSNHPNNDDIVFALCAKDDASRIFFATERGYSAYSDDKTATWTAVPFNDAGAINTVVNNPFACAFVGNSNRVVAGDNEDPIFAYSDDGGVNWIASSVTTTSTAGVRQLRMSPDGFGVACGDSLLIITSDGGATWTEPTAPGIADFGDFYIGCGLW